MRVTFWGTRGSCPTFPAPWEVQEYANRVTASTIEATLAYLKTAESPEALQDLLQRSPQEILSEVSIAFPPIYGGETTCIEVETSEGNVIILDCGSGIRHCSAEILRQRAETNLKEITLFGSHGHLDHRIGLSFAGVCFANPPFDIQIYGCSGFLKALDERFALFSHIVTESTYHDDPVDYTLMSASISGTEIRALGGDEEPKGDLPWATRDIAEPVQIGSTVVRAFKAYHGLTECLGYRIEHGGKVFVFSTDHERLSPDMEIPPELGEGALEESLKADRELVEVCRDADLAYFDGQYLREEYFGRKSIGASPAVSRVGWGHGCVEDILNRAMELGIGQCLIGHHDPQRSWPAQVSMAEHLQEFAKAKNIRVELAQDGQSVEL